MKKKLTAAILSVVMLLMSGSVFAAGTETVFQSCLKIMTHCWCSC